VCIFNLKLYIILLVYQLEKSRRNKGAIGCSAGGEDTKFCYQSPLFCNCAAMIKIIESQKKTGAYIFHLALKYPYP
jgi:hypothetical protein